MPWLRRMLRDAKVFVRADADGRPVAGDDGRVDVLYKLAAGARVYRASLRNLAATGDPADDVPIDTPDPAAAELGDAGAAAAPAPTAAPSRAPAPAHGARATATTARPIDIYTDGACTGNPGPMGIGVVILDGRDRRELSEYLGTGTNNIAELTAMLRGLEEVAPADRTRPVRIYSDSAYSIGLLTQGWKAKANVELVARLRFLASGFPRLSFVKVAGHAGVPENERCDSLAREAIVRRRSAGG